MAGSKRNGRKKAQLSLFDENELADMEPVRHSSEDKAPADLVPAAEPVPVEISSVHEPAKKPHAPSEQKKEKEAVIKTKYKKDQEARLAALWKARGKK